MVIWDDTKKEDIPSYEKIEATYYDKSNDYEMIKLDGLWYGPVTDRHWNGEHYGPVQAYKEANDIEPIDNDKYTLEPIQIPVGEPDEDGEYDGFEIIGYRISVY